MRHRNSRALKIKTGVSGEKNLRRNRIFSTSAREARANKSGDDMLKRRVAMAFGLAEEDVTIERVEEILKDKRLRLEKLYAANGVVYSNE